MASALPDPLYTAELTRICLLIPAIVTIYDHALTLSQEVELVWSRQWCIAKITFLWNRYLGVAAVLIPTVMVFVTPPSDRVSLHWFRAQISMTVVVVLSMECVMLFRVFAVHQSFRNALVLLLISLAISMCGTLVVSFRFFNATRESVVLGHYFCRPIYSSSHNYFHVLWLSLAAFNLVLLGLVLWLHVKQQQNRVTDPMTKGKSMIEVLLQDSILYLSVTLIIFLATALLWNLLSPNWFAIPLGFSIAATSVLGSRLALNLRAAHSSHAPAPSHPGDLTTVDDIISRLRFLPRGSVSRDRHPKKDILRRVSGLLHHPSTSSIECPAPAIQWRWNERSGKLEDVIERPSSD
ncbi:hypothetical protein C8J56DRAFT_559554 [Mycena floridula]|nr:hypothetical protein C8J56DRAFT_559554 [Mycena floridula]